MLTKGVVAILTLVIRPRLWERDGGGPLGGGAKRHSLITSCSTVIKN
jgi:hypothetical protein